MVICTYCDNYESENVDPWKHPLPLLNPTEKEVVAYHRAAECVNVDPPGINYNHPANWGR